MDIMPFRRRAGRPLMRFHDEMDDFVQRLFGDWAVSETGWLPALDIGEQDEAYLIKAELPGVQADDIEISVHGKQLTLAGEKQQQTEQDERGPYHTERRYGSFRREITLPGEVDADAIDAHYADGVLTVTLPKSEAAKPKRIEVKH